MAKIETINGFETINVTASVGRNGVNLKDDVVAVQALLKYVLEDYESLRGVALPEPTGTLDKNTAWLIKKYQQNLNKLLKGYWKIVADGRISPGKNGFVHGTNVHWTIVVLNEEADLGYRQKRPTPGGYIKDMCRRFPQLAAVLDNSVGTLGLSLEPSAPGVGSLNLGLE